MRLWLCLALIPMILLNSKVENALAIDNTVRILFTNNSNGKLVNCNCPNDNNGGLAERVSFFRSYREHHSDFLLLDSGGYFGLSNIRWQGTVVLELMKLMGYDIWGIGDQELYYGLGNFLELFGEYRENICNASLYTQNDSPVFTPYRFVTVGNIRIGIIGLVSNETFKYFPRGDKDFNVEDPDSTMIRLLPELRGSSDYIIVLSQMGKAEDVKFAERWPDINLIIGGHSQSLLKEALHISDCYIVQAGKGGGCVGEIVLTFNSLKNVKDFSYKLIEVSDAYPISSDIKKLLDRAKNLHTSD